MNTRTILVTNDDGIESLGLHAVVKALDPLAQIVVVAPDSNQSGVSRSITLGQTLEVNECEVPGADHAFSTSGTPTDCVRLAMLGIAGPRPDMVVSGANRGLNIGDDVAYSGTVAAAFDGAMNGVPSIAISQQSVEREMGYPRSTEFDYDAMGEFLAQFVGQMFARWDSLDPQIVTNINVPGCPSSEIQGVEVGVPGKRIYRDKLELQSSNQGKHHYTLYGDDPLHHIDEKGTDISAIGRHCIAVTPLRFDVADFGAIAWLNDWNLTDLVQ